MHQANNYPMEHRGPTQLLKLKLHNAVWGREAEVEAVKMHFDSVLEGNSALTLISGDIGVGKTVLAKKTLADLARSQGTCVSGKFEQYKEEEPYIAVIQVIEYITDVFLTLSEANLDLIKAKLLRSLKKDGSLIAEIAPKVERVIGKQPKVNIDDYRKLKTRLAKAFRDFIQIAAMELEPLVIFIDDVQWIDNPSWEIIKSVYEDSPGINVFILMAYRNNKSEYVNRIEALLNDLIHNENIHQIELGSLPYETVKTMVVEVFNQDDENTAQLARLLHRKTMGNPLYLKQTINLLLEQDSIRYHYKQGRWLLESENIDAVGLPNGIEDIINRKINSLGQEAKELLEIAACIGSRFDMKLLKEITGYEALYLEEKLKVLASAGLIVETIRPAGNSRNREFEFFHDRILQNIYEQMAPGRKEQLHYKTALHLLNHADRVYVQENLLSIAAHLLNCKGIIIREGVPDRLIADLYFAGLKAKQAAAVEYAVKLFGFAEELLDESCWREDYGNTLKIKLELAECEFICGFYGGSKAHFEEMLANAAGNEDLVEIYKRYMILNSYTGEYDAVIKFGLQALNLLGFKINTRALPLGILKEVLESMLLFRDNRLQLIKNAPLLNDKRTMKILELMYIMAPVANMTNEELFALLILKSTNLSVKYGTSIYSPIDYAAYSFVLGSVLGDYQKAKKVKEISLHLVELIDDNALKCAAFFIIGTLVEHWHASAQVSFNYLQKSFDLGVQSGEYFYSGFAITSMIEMKYYMGGPLHELEKFLILHEKYGKKMNQDVLLRLVWFFRDHIISLTSTGSSPEERWVKEQEISTLQTNDIVFYNLLKIQRLYLEGQLDEAHALSEETIKKLDSVTGFIIQVDLVFYFMLLSLIRKQRCGITKPNQKALVKYRKKLKIWMERSPDNHYGKYLLIEAIAGSLDGKANVAGLFDEAIDHAKATHNLMLEALGNYLAADYYGGNWKVTKVYARDAWRLFNEWGAVKVAARIGRIYNIFDDSAVREVSAASIMDETDDLGREKTKSFEERLNGCQQELERLELEESYQYFLETVCKEARADHGAILLENDDQIKLEYGWRSSDEDARRLAGVEAERYGPLPQKVIRYVSRTYEEVLIETKPTEGLFSNDDYIGSRESISIICLPLKYKGIFAGLVYLENNKDHGMDLAAIDFIKRLSFYLVAKPSLEKDEFGNRAFINDSVNEKLTERELEVLCCIAQGMASKEIGVKLHISLNTVKTHTLNIYGKLEAGSRVRAVSKAKALGLI